MPAVRTEQVMKLISDRIERRALTKGARIPSLRAMAEFTGFSKSTVVEAYDRLAASGVIKSRSGSGFFIAAPLAPLALERFSQDVEREVDPLWMLRQSLTERSDALRPGCGWLPDSWLAGDTIRKRLRTIARNSSETPVIGYASLYGLPSLRNLLARRLADQGVELSPDQILLTDSSTHSLDLVCRFLLQPGDTVLVDDPCYFNYITLLRAHRINIVSIPMTPNGPDISAFSAAVEEHRPRIYLTNSTVQNPTGATMSAAIAHRLLKYADTHEIVIVEDDVFGDFDEKPSPQLAAFDGLDKVIRIGSYSKSLSAAARCGHIAARPDWIEALADLRISTSMSGSSLSAEILHGVLTDGSYRRHIEAVRARLAHATDRVVKRLRGVGIEPWIEPQAGMFVWAKLPNGIEAAPLAKKGMKEDIIFAPGNVFSASASWKDYMRFNVAMSDDDKIFNFLSKVLK